MLARHSKGSVFLLFAIMHEYGAPRVQRRQQFSGSISRLLSRNCRLPSQNIRVIFSLASIVYRLHIAILSES